MELRGAEDESIRDEENQSQEGLSRKWKHKKCQNKSQWLFILIHSINQHSFLL